MSSRIALIDPNGYVANVIVWPDDQPTPDIWNGHAPHALSAGERCGPGWGHDPTHPARFAPQFRDDLLEPDPETGAVPLTGPVFREGRIYDPDTEDWPPSGPPDGKGWKRLT